MTSLLCFPDVEEIHVGARRVIASCRSKDYQLDIERERVAGDGVNVTTKVCCSKKQ